MSTKNTIIDCQNIAASKNGLCLSVIYKDNRNKLEWQCEIGHKWWASFSHIKSSNSWCPYCCGNMNNSIELCHSLASAKNGKCLSIEYKNAFDKLEWQCEFGHKWFAAFNKIKSLNRWCPYCAGVAKLNIQECIDLAASKNGKCLDNFYLNNRDYMKWQCSEGHIWEAKYNYIKMGQWCPFCVGKHINIIECQELAASRNGKCLDEEYINCDQQMKWMCNKGHKWEATYNNVKNNKTWCPKCCFNSPKQQQNIEEYIQSLGFETVFNDNKQIKPKHLDIFIPEKSIGIEFNGLYWHGEKCNKDTAKYKHLHKFQLCQEKNIRLITIFEDEWLLKQEQVKGYLRAILGKTENKIGARKCEIKEVINQIAKQFHMDNHIQGSSDGKHYGLFYNEKLIVLSTFAKPNASRNAAKNNENKIELMRYTVKINYSIQGGLGKLLNHFIKNNQNIQEIISYSDNRWSEGKIYKALKFQLINTGKPSYFYFKNGGAEKYHRYNFTKHKALQMFGGDINTETEWSIMEKNGYDRIWDCGSSKWVLKIK